MLTTEQLDRLEASARKQIGPEMTTTVVVGPGELLKLIEMARYGADLKNHPAFLVDGAIGTAVKL